VSRAPISAPSQFGECPKRLTDRGRLVPELRFAGARGFPIRSADDPVVGLHHWVGGERLPLDGADHENRQATVVREARGAVGEVALPCRRSRAIPMQKDPEPRGAGDARGGSATGWRRQNCSPGGTRSAIRASMRRSASTSASAQSRSIVVVAGRMVRVRRQASTRLAKQGQPA